ncbi:MAG: putative cysteine desulfurase [Friedmanniella sp.]|nr:putative cysteine desulfurase [Friedmanniella sp.]
MTRSYLDHASTTPMVAPAVAALTAELTQVGNPSSLHGSGRAARRVVEEARELIADRLGARPVEVIFTSGGTEADNLAVKGAFWSRREPHRREVLTTTVEHHAVSDAVAWLAQSAGAEWVLADVDEIGRLRPEELRACLTERTAVVSVIWGNNEIGTVQPVSEVAARAAAVGAVSHSDAVQAVGHLEVDFAASGLDLLTVTAHKLGGPKGVGALLARRETALTSLLHGGGQERDVRSGTLDPAAIAGFAAAVDLAVDGRPAEEARLRRLRGDLVAAVLAAVPDAVLQGTLDPQLSLPGISNFVFPGCSADSVLMLLDAAGIDCSTGSACSAGVSQPSHVLMALGRSEVEARSALRFSLGHSSTTADVAALAAALPQAVLRARAAAAYA